jgi:hypothetical protein
MKDVCCQKWYQWMSRAELKHRQKTEINTVENALKLEEEEGPKTPPVNIPKIAILPATPNLPKKATVCVSLLGFLGSDHISKNRFSLEIQIVHEASGLALTFRLMLHKEIFLSPWGQKSINNGFISRLRTRTIASGTPLTDTLILMSQAT